MTKAQIIAEITAFYTIVGAARETTSTDTSIPSSIKTYEILVYETGNSELSKKPVLRSKYVNFIVYDEGGAGEAAYYYDNEPVNDVNTDISGDSSLISINKIFSSTSMKRRVQAAIAKAAQSIFYEAIPSSLLTSNASSGQKNVIVTSGNIFWSGKTIIIGDNDASETNTIYSINGNTLTMQNNLANNYQTSKNAYVKYQNNVERMQWATNALLDPETYTLSMTNLVALDATVQSSGGTVSDSVIQNIVNGNINNIAVISYL